MKTNTQHTPGPWTANHLSYAEAGALMRSAGHTRAADEADEAERLWFDDTQPEGWRERAAEVMFRAAIARAETDAADAGGGQ